MPIDTMPATDDVAAEADASDESAATSVSPSAGAELVADELLVEEISIDGMCGVY